METGFPRVRGTLASIRFTRLDLYAGNEALEAVAVRILDPSSDGSRPFGKVFTDRFWFWPRRELFQGRLPN